METQVASNVGKALERQLGRAFGGGANALGTSDPNTLAGGRALSMGIARGAGMVSFCHNAGAQLNITVYFWSELRQKWVRLGPVASVYTLAVDDNAQASVAVAAGMRLFFQGSAASTDFWVGGLSYDNNSSSPKDLAA